MDFITKLGGAAITNKEVLETLHNEGLSTAAKSLASCYKNGRRFVVVHGAGSFGHQLAKQFAVNHGYQENDPRGVKGKILEGFCRVRLSVCKLNQHVVSALVNEGVPAVAMSPCSLWLSSGNQGAAENLTSAVKQLTSRGYIPCLHGDCIVDDEQGCRILSGDTIIQTLSREFRPERVVFLTDVPGVFTKPPREAANAELIREIVVEDDGRTNIAVQTSAVAHDVTGGIELKLKSAAGIVRDGRGSTRVYVCDLEVYQSICEGKETENLDHSRITGTLIRFGTS